MSIPNVWERAPIVIHESEAADRLATLAATQAGMVFVEACCRKLLDPEGDASGASVLQRALWSAALVAYVRCTWDLRRDPKTKWVHEMIKGKIGEIPGDSLKFHQFVLDMRNKFVAHNVNAFDDFQVGLVLPMEDAPEEDVQDVGILVRQLLYGAKDAENLALIAGTLLPFLKGESERIKGEILEEVKGTPIEELRERPKIRSVFPGHEQAGRKR